MDCVICKNGTTSPGFATVTFENNQSVVVIKDVPAHICNNCGHYYLAEDYAEKVLAIASETVKKGVEIEVTHFKAAS